MAQLSVFVTTFNNASTLDACLRAVSWADEVVVLDSYSSDETCEIATRHGCELYQHEFLGYGPQKQMALDKTSHDWVLLLDADEVVSEALAEEIHQTLTTEPEVDGFEMPRREQVFWRMAAPSVRMNHYLRLFRKSKGRLNDVPIHAAPIVDGRVARLKGWFSHLGEVDIRTKVEKINAYSDGLVAHKSAERRGVSPLILVFYPPFFFIRSFVFKRGFMNGWAGFIASVVGSFYVFLKYAKLYEHFQSHHSDPEQTDSTPR